MRGRGGGSGVGGCYKNAGVEFGTVLEKVNLGLVRFGLAEVDLHIVVALGGTYEHLAVPEEVLRVGVGKVAVAPERSVVVLQDAVVVLLDDRADEVRLGLVSLDLALNLEQVLPV
jgi:hypothetical protein